MVRASLNSFLIYRHTISSTHSDGVFTTTWCQLFSAHSDLVPSLLYWWYVCQLHPHHLTTTSLRVTSHHGNQLYTDHSLLQHSLQCDYQSCQLCRNEWWLNSYYYPHWLVNSSLRLCVCTLSLPTVTCPSSPSAASGVVNILTPSVPIVGSTLTFSCSEYQDGMTEQSTCGSDGQWSPDPETFSCPTPCKLAILFHTTHVSLSYSSPSDVSSSWSTL